MTPKEQLLTIQKKLVAPFKNKDGDFYIPLTQNVISKANSIFEHLTGNITVLPDINGGLLLHKETVRGKVFVKITHTDMYLTFFYTTGEILHETYTTSELIQLVYLISEI